MAPLCTVLRPEEHDARPASAGRPIPTVELRVVDPNTREPVEVGKPGEVQYRSPQLFSGYWNKAEQTQEAFMDRSEEHTSELQSRGHLVCRLLLGNNNHQI